jgi:GT2 family glycosyltransferase
MQLSVVIVSWNTRALLLQCLESIFTFPPECAIEIFVVDNASSDGSADIVRQRFPQVELIVNRENLGFAHANNQALCRCHGEAILLLNPDTEIKPGAFQAMLAFLRENPGAGAVGPLVLNPDGTLQHSCSPTPTLFRETLRLLHLPGMRPDGYYPMQHWDRIAPREVDVLLGAGILLRHDVLNQIGLLDEDYFIYSEEVDLCSRLKNNGWKIYWVPAAQIIHYGGQSTQQVAQEMFFRLYESKLKYFRKHRGSSAAKRYKLLLGFVSLIRLAFIPFALFKRSASRQQYLKQADNYRRLLAALPGM